MVKGAGPFHPLSSSICLSYLSGTHSCSCLCYSFLQVCQHLSQKVAQYFNLAVIPLLPPSSLLSSILKSLIYSSLYFLNSLTHFLLVSSPLCLSTLSVPLPLHLSNFPPLLQALTLSVSISFYTFSSHSI